MEDENSDQEKFRVQKQKYVSARTDRLGRIRQVDVHLFTCTCVGSVSVGPPAFLEFVAMSKTGAVVDIEKLDKAKRAPTEQTVWAPEDG